MLAGNAEVVLVVAGNQLAAAADVETVIVDGRPAVREGKLVQADGGAVRAEAQETAERILDRLDTSESAAALEARRGGPRPTGP